MTGNVLLESLKNIRAVDVVTAAIVKLCRKTDQKPEVSFTNKAIHLYDHGHTTAEALLEELEDHTVH